MAVALIAVWATFVGVSSLVSPDDSIDADTAAFIEQNRAAEEAERSGEEAAEAERAEREALLIEELRTEQERRAEAEAALAEVVGAGRVEPVSGDYASADAAPGSALLAPWSGRATRVPSGQIPPVVGQLPMTEQAERLAFSLTRANQPAFAAYHSVLGVVLIDLVSTQSWILEIPRAIAPPDPGAPLLRTGSITVAFDEATGEVSLVGEDSTLVVADTVDGAIYRVDATNLTGQAALVEVFEGDRFGSHFSPNSGFQLQVFDGLGLLAVPNTPDGATLLSNKDEFGVLSNSPIVSASGGGVVEQVCVDGQGCSLAVSTIDLSGATEPERRELPTTFGRFGDRYLLSPDGNMVLRHSPAGFAEILVVDAGAVAWVTGVGMQHPTWGPESAFVAWIDMVGEPKLELMFPQDRSWISVNLADYGVPPPVGQDLVVFAKTEVPPES